MFEQLFPSECNLQVDRIEVADKRLEIHASTTSASAACPQCGITGNRRHSFYQRYPMDLPCFGYKVRLNLTVQRFLCENKACGRVTFAESFPGLVAYKARRTERLSQQQLSVAFELGGEAGRRILAIVSMNSSGDTLLRDILRAPEPVVNTPCVLGIDDWANCKGRDYGTIFVDLETHQPVDLLDSREASVVKTWLQSHAGVEVICRDRGKEYIKAANAGAPDAEQVADRWHLLKNIRETLQIILTHKPECLKGAAQQPLSAAKEQFEEEQQSQLSDPGEMNPSSPSSDIDTRPAKPIKAEQDKAAVHARQPPSTSVNASAPTKTPKSWKPS